MHLIFELRNLVQCFSFLISILASRLHCTRARAATKKKKNTIVQYCDNLDNCCFLFLLMLIVWEHWVTECPLLCNIQLAQNCPPLRLLRLYYGRFFCGSANSLYSSVIQFSACSSVSLISSVLASYRVALHLVYPKSGQYFSSQ